MAYAIIGGLFVATLLTLLFLPALYLACFRIKEPRKEPEPHLGAGCARGRQVGAGRASRKPEKQDARACPRRRTDQGAWGFGREVGRDADFAGIDPRQDSEFQIQH